MSRQRTLNLVGVDSAEYSGTTVDLPSDDESDKSNTLPGILRSYCCKKFSDVSYMIDESD